MAWSDAARRAAIIARRLKRVQNYEAPVSRRYDQWGRKAYLEAKLGQRLKRVQNVARTRFRFSPFPDLLRRERGR